MVKTPSQVLRDAWLLHEDPAHWTQGAAARNQDQGPEHPQSSSAVCWCPIGAVLRVCGHATENAGPGWDAIELLNRVVGPEWDGGWLHPVARYNNDPCRLHGEIVALYPKAIALAESEASHAS